MITSRGMSRKCSTNEKKRKACKLMVGKPERERSLGRPRYRSVDNIKIDLGAIGWGDMDCIKLGQDMDHCRTFLNMVMNLWVS
jgi:hypothetical protein